MIFWILFVWLPLVVGVIFFCIENINGFDVSFNIKELLLLAWFLFFEFGVILTLLSVLDDAINYYIWREHEKN